MAAAYPMLLAMGAAMGERWLASLPRWGRAHSRGCLLRRSRRLRSLRHCRSSCRSRPAGRCATSRSSSNGDLREEIGWDELVKTVAGIRDSLPPDQQAHLGIIVGNYGEQGAIEMLGPAYRLPPPISTTNSAWLRGYPTPPPTTLIVLGVSREEADAIFTGCRLAGHNGNSEGVQERREQVPPRHLCLRPPAPALAGVLEAITRLRLRQPLC